MSEKIADRPLADPREPALDGDGEIFDCEEINLEQAKAMTQEQRLTEMNRLADKMKDTGARPTYAVVRSWVALRTAERGQRIINNPRASKSAKAAAAEPAFKLDQFL